MASKKNKIFFHLHQYSKMEIEYIKKRSLSLFFEKMKNKIKSSRKQIQIFIFLIFCAWAMFQLTRIGALVLEYKNKIVNQAAFGLNKLDSAKTALLNNDPLVALENFESAEHSLIQTQELMGSLEKSLFGLSNVIPQKKEAKKLLEASIAISKAGQLTVALTEQFSGINLQSSNFNSQMDFILLEKKLSALYEQLYIAQSNLNKVNEKRLPPNITETVITAKNQLNTATMSVKMGQSLAELLGLIFHGQNRILFILQNNNELRPTGGFIGSYAALLLNNGKLDSIKISSIYDLDGQLTEDIAPPWPLKAVNTKWFMRDSNWFTSFDISASKIISFYEKTGGETPDFLMAITPTLIADILKITGPVKIAENNYISSEQFIEQAQILTQTDKKDPSNEPKKILGIIFVNLFQKLNELTAQQKSSLILTVIENLNAKQFLIYSKKKPGQKILSRFNWSGSILTTNRDYLLISSANLGGTKTDMYLTNNLTLETEIDLAGNIINTLTLKRKNTLPDIDGADNTSFFRFYAPLGSELIDSSGFDNLTLDTQQNLNLKMDRDVQAWENFQKKALLSGTITGIESGKTFFANWLVVNGNETKTAILKYKLPFKIKKTDYYSLVFQKQPGAKEAEFVHILNFPQRISTWQTDSDAKATKSSMILNKILNKDYFFGMVLKKDEPN